LRLKYTVVLEFIEGIITGLDLPHLDAKSPLVLPTPY
jgi:hypothetical protein